MSHVHLHALGARQLITWSSCKSRRQISGLHQAKPSAGLIPQFWVISVHCTDINRASGQLWAFVGSCSVHFSPCINADRPTDVYCYLGVSIGLIRALSLQNLTSGLRACQVKWISVRPLLEFPSTVYLPCWLTPPTQTYWNWPTIYLFRVFITCTRRLLLLCNWTFNLWLPSCCWGAWEGDYVLYCLERNRYSFRLRQFLTADDLLNDIE